MTFYVVHKLKVKNPQSLTEAMAAESLRLFKTAKARLLHSIAAILIKQTDGVYSIGNLVGDSDSDKQHWLLGFDISSANGNESAISELLEWINAHILDIVSSLQGVIFEPRLNIALLRGRSPGAEIEASDKEQLIELVHNFILGYLSEHDCIKLRDFSGLAENAELTIHPAEQLSASWDTTRIHTFKGRVTSYDGIQKTIKVISKDVQANPNGEEFQPARHTSAADTDTEGYEEEREDNNGSTGKSKFPQKPNEESFFINTDDFSSVKHQSKYMPWEKKFNMEIEFRYQVLDGRKHVCLRLDEEYDRLLPGSSE
ncbi:MAG TPA: hypothetical protein VGE55_14050 [Limnobacter sp.]|uniref:hypothetical protein n=1 Tax=Limnobacter sp. TaxID=2003368 RepID=UPI002ED91A3F